jgi:putative pyruvate formate lyase activating enzyme
VSRIGKPEAVPVLAFIANGISRDTYLNLMEQYRPCYRAAEYPAIDRPTSAQEYGDALRTAARFALTRLDRRH